jgi:hypothetical protein
MTTAIYVYVGLYVLFYAWVVADDIGDGEPLWETLGDLVLSALSLLGMIFYLSGVADEGVRAVWKVVSILLVAGQVVLNFYGRHLTLKGEKETMKGEIRQPVILAADIAAVAFLLPSLALNVLFAYRPNY